MGYKTELQSNNADLQTILNTINAMDGGSEVESTFVPTDSGDDSYGGLIGDNNVDLQKILELALSLPDAPSLISFTITPVNSGNPSYTLQAEEGMTWGEWLDSSYNTTNGDIYIEDFDYPPLVFHSSGYRVCASSSSVHTTDVIIDGFSYTYT